MLNGYFYKERPNHEKCKFLHEYMGYNKALPVSAYMGLFLYGYCNYMVNKAMYLDVNKIFH
jgi:hypothetical protein